MKSQDREGFAPRGCSELWGEPLVADELPHSSQPLPSCPAIKPETPSLMRTGTRTHLKSCLKCDRTYYSKLTPPLLFILLGTWIRIQLRIPNLNFFTFLALQLKYLHSVQKYWRGSGDAPKARFRHLQTDVLSSLPLPGVLLTSSIPLPAQQPCLGPSAEAHGTGGSVLSTSAIPLPRNTATLPF